MFSTDHKMLKRKGADDLLADVEESKKAKSDVPTEESEKNNSDNPEIASDPSTEKATEILSTKPTVERSKAEKEFSNPTRGPDTPPEESTERKSTESTVEARIAESKLATSTIGPDPPPEESAENKSAESTVETNSSIKPDLTNEKLTEIKPANPTAEAPHSEDAPNYMQVIITGPPKCGKSCLVLSYMEQLFPPMYGEFLSKQYLHILREYNQPVMIWDLDARNEFTEYRYQSYQEADIALLCFNVKIPKDSRRVSLESLLHPWITEIDRHCDGIPIILVGLMGDLRRNSNWNFFSEDDIKTMLKRYPRIELYKEVSTFMDRDGVQELFATAIACISEQKPKVMFTNRVSKIAGDYYK